MRLTEEELKAMQARVTEKAQVRPSSILGTVVQRAKGSAKPKERGMNKTELAYSRVLEAEKKAGRLTWWQFEPVKLRLADGCGLTPDFMTMDADGFITMVDTKAYWASAKKVGVTDDSLVKMKVAAETFPMFRFIMTWQKEGLWEEREF